ncbi:RAM signaling network component [Coniosporium tulheliwenetii]|uniref:RAM signaling network component n=1 Tax=Coniosporium tulheliwenetii TaxID=3383036 RepID=A0ACC2Z4U1_9PEZI|nr:RAM signaling network component [Cladosporium sp. JES 115]
MNDQAVIAIAHQVVDEAHRSAAGTDATTQDLQRPGITFDLSHKKLSNLPSEVIEIIRHDIERFALSHNMLSSLPANLSVCSKLRYLNLKNNLYREIPQPVLELTSLEILDISKNRLRALPEEMFKLVSLRVLTIQKNRIEKLPLCLGEMSNLHRLRLEGNPLTFPPAEVYTIQQDTPSPSNEAELEVVITTRIKKHLRVVLRQRVDSEGEARSSAPVPARSHFRVQSQQQNVAQARPGIAPLLIGSERNRSQSESVMSGSTNIRAKRMGIVPRKSSDLRTVNEASQATLRQQQFPTYSSNVSAADPNPLASFEELNISNRLSDLPEDVADPHSQAELDEHDEAEGGFDDLLSVAEIGRTTLYTLQKQLEDCEKVLQSMGEHGALFLHRFHTFSEALGIHLVELERLIKSVRDLAPDDEERVADLWDAIESSIQDCIEAYGPIDTFMNDNNDEIVEHAHEGAVRSLIVSEYAGTMAMRGVLEAELGVEFVESEQAAAPQNIRSQVRSITPTQQQPFGLPIMQTSLDHVSAVRAPAMGSFPSSIDNSRSNTLSSTIAATPSSAGSFPANLPSARTSRSNTMHGVNDLQEEQQFEQIFLKLKHVCELAQGELPGCRSVFIKGQANAQKIREPDGRLLGLWSHLVEKTDEILRAVTNLQARLSEIVLRDPTARNQHGLWQSAITCLKSCTDLLASVKEMARYGVVMDEATTSLRPIHKAVKEVSVAITNSPWSLLAVGSGATGPLPAPAAPPPLPATPLSAALGPAAQATVPTARRL